MKKLILIGITLVACGLSMQNAKAGSITTLESNETYATCFDDVPGTGATLSATNVWANTGSLLQLNNGGTGSTTDISVGFGILPSTTVTYTFDLTEAEYGWDIDEITSYAMWNGGSGGRTRQGYIVTATFMDDSTLEVVSPNEGIDYYVSGLAEGSDADYSNAVGYTSTKVDITDLALTGVKSLTFSDFAVIPAGYGAIYNEIDVFGSPTEATPVPEPGTCVLLVMGLIGLAAVAKQKRQ